MPAPIGHWTLAPLASTGSNTHTAVDLQVQSEGDTPVTFLFVVEAVGGSPTVTWSVQGSHDNTNWFAIPYVTDATDTLSVATRTATAAGAQIEWLASGPTREFRYYRLVTTANTNVTYHADLYIQSA